MDIQSIIDKDNKFIEIKIKNDNFHFIFKDSMRIFPVSLSDLCKSMFIKGKTSDYDKIWQSFSLFRNKLELYKFYKYAAQDSRILLQASAR